MGYLIPSELGGPPDDPISHEVWVGPRGLDDSYSCSGSSRLAQADESSGRLV